MTLIPNGRRRQSNFTLTGGKHGLRARRKSIDRSPLKRSPSICTTSPYIDNKKVRVAGPFTVESLSPHRALGVDENDELIDGVAESKDGFGEQRSFVQMILENLKTAGVQRAHKEDKNSLLRR